jgi:hypothetical protein
MSAVLPHYKQGPANYQVSTLIFGGQLVENTTQTAGTTDFTVKVAGAASTHVLGVAGGDANVIATQTGAANTYGQPQIDISVLGDYVSVYYGGVDIWVWYLSGSFTPGVKLLAAALGAVSPAGAGPAADQVIGICTQPGGVTAGMCTQQIGGQGAASYFLGRARIF